MFPRIFTFKTPEFLRGIFPSEIVANSYGLCIGLGLISAFFILYYKTKSLGMDFDKLSELFLWGFVAAFIGGKVFFYLEDPQRYINNPSLMFKQMGNGFVFYGSLIFVIPTMYVWLRFKKISFWPFMDGMAFAGPVLHSFGRLGCFLAGCCHGKVCHNGWGVVFTDPHSVANPKNVPLYPTQLFDIAINLITLLFVYLVSRNQNFKGQLFLLYIVLYGIGRVINESFRGDEERGFLFGGLVSNSQFIAFILISLCCWAWIVLSKRKEIIISDSQEDASSKIN